MLYISLFRIPRHIFVNFRWLQVTLKFCSSNYISYIANEPELGAARVDAPAAFLGTPSAIDSPSKLQARLYVVSAIHGVAPKSKPPRTVYIGHHEYTNSRLSFEEKNTPELPRKMIHQKCRSFLHTTILLNKIPISSEILDDQFQHRV